jgi:Glycosyl hydrolases family 18
VADKSLIVGAGVRASHVGGNAAPGLIIRAADVTATGTTTPRAGGRVRPTDLSTPVQPGNYPNMVRIGSATYTLSGVSPGSAGGWGGDGAYPGFRGVDQLVVYSRPAVTATATNQYGAEVPTDSDLVVNSVNDRQASGSTAGTAVPAGGYVVSGHGAARDWLLAHATIGALVELTYVTPGGGGGGGGAYPDRVIAVYKMIYANSGSAPIGSIPSGCNEIRLAFAFGSPLGLAGYGPEGKTALISAMSAFRAAGKRVILSVGGSGNSVTMSNATNFISQFDAIRTDLAGNVDGMDFDMEASGFTTQQAVDIAVGLKSRYGSAFAITMVPNGGNVSTYLPAAVAMHNAGALDNYGQQFYDSQVSLSAAEGRIDEAINNGVPASKISVGMMNPPGSVSNGYWDNPTCAANMTAIRDKYGIHKAYYWEGARVGAGNWVNNMAAIL